MTITHRTRLKPGNRIQLPAEWAHALGLRGWVILDRTADGILVRPSAPKSWDEIFATKLPIAPPVEGPVNIEVTRDDLTF